MASPLSNVKAFHLRFWRRDAPLTATALVMLVALVGCCIGLAVDPRLVAGAPLWAKPAKFALSIAVYCLTLAWMFGYIPSFKRTRKVVGWGTAFAMLIEMGIISFQAARGTTSHFNVSTPLDATLFGIMGIAIVTQTFTSVAVAVALFRQPFADHALGWALRLGMALTIAGALLGGTMTRPSARQIEDMQSGKAMASGAHTVGASDGEPGMAVTGWSRKHGDLRIPHFIALHALQVLPLVAIALRRTRASSRQRVALVAAAAGSYLSLVGIVLWQALRGQSWLATDTLALGVLCTWGLVSAALGLLALGFGAKNSYALSHSA